MKKLVIIVMIILIIVPLSEGTLGLYKIKEVEASNELMPMNAARERDGASYWATSNIREWLNSENKNVVYTNNLPKYKDESGFLEGFTDRERESIAVTKRRSFLAGNDSKVKDGGTTQLPYVTMNSTYYFMNHAMRDFDVNWKKYNYHNLNDKVFLLSPHEIHYYVQQKGISLRKKNMSGSFHSWWSTSNLWNGNYERPMYIGAAGEIYRSSASNNRGVVPAVHLKPDTIMNTGKRARQLDIGEKVTFGEYENRPIEWIVINKTSEGYPLLWTDKILTIKQFQEGGKEVYRYSEGVHYKETDVDISNDLQIFNEKGDIKPPRLYVENKGELNERQNESFTLKLKAEDESGIEKIILPDGTVVTGDEASFKINENKNYNFQAVDKAGNYTGILIPINNINPPAKVDISFSNEGWTNEDVEVNIQASNDYENYETNRVRVKSSTEPYFKTYPNSVTYAHKRVRITGAVELVKATRPLENYSIGVNITYQVRSPLKDGFTVGSTYPIEYIAKLSEIENKPKNFDVTMTVGSNYYNSLRVGSRYNTPKIWESGQYEVEFTNLKYELLDTDDFEIAKIILPDGTEVLDSRYTTTIKEDGQYTFKVLDNRGKTTSKTVEVKIDKEKPTLNIKQDVTEKTKENVTLKVKAIDNLSGVKRIKNPDGVWKNGDNLDYEVSKNGTYRFTVEDHAGNTTTKSVKVSNIDKTPPTMNLIPDKTKPTNKPVVIKIDTKDADSGLKTVTFNNPPKNDYGRNLIKKSHDFSLLHGHKGSTYDVETDIRVPEWNATDAVKVHASGGSHKVKFYGGIEVPSTKGQEYTLSVWVKNIGKYPVYIRNNLGSSEGVQSGESRKVTVTGKGNGTSNFQIHFETSNANIDKPIDFIAWRPKGEYGTEATPYSTAYEDDIVKQVVVPENGTYSFTAIDNVGNTTTKTIKVANIVEEEFDLEVPNLKPFEDITIKDTTEEYHTGMYAPIKIKDIWGSDEGWRLDVSATPFSVKKNKGQSKVYELPRGTVKINPIKEIKSITQYEGEKPRKVLTKKTSLDGGTVTLAESKTGVGEWELIFPKDAISINIDPSTARIDNENYPNQPTPYESTITWDLVYAP